MKPGATTTSKEWFRPNPPLDSIMWSPRANTNIQESAILFALNRVAKDKEMFLENYWIKNKHAVDRGKKGPVYAWVIPANQHARENAAEAVNELETQGLEFHRANVVVQGGQRAGQRRRLHHPRRPAVPHDRRHVLLAPELRAGQSVAVRRHGLDVPADAQHHRHRDHGCERSQAADDGGEGHVVTAPGGITGTGSTVVVENNSDNTLVSFRFKYPNVKMSAAEESFDADGHHFAAGAFIIANANRAQLEPSLKTLGLTAYAMASAPTVKSHDLDIPRIGYIHSWTRTQDEGWVRAALDTYGVPYKYFGENAVAKMGDLRSKFDVLIYPHGGSGVGGGRRWPWRWRRGAGPARSVQEHEGIPVPRLSRIPRTTSAARWARKA